MGLLDLLTGGDFKNPIAKHKALTYEYDWKAKMERDRSMFDLEKAEQEKARLRQKELLDGTPELPEFQIDYYSDAAKQWFDDNKADYYAVIKEYGDEINTDPEAREKFNAAKRKLVKENPFVIDGLMANDELTAANKYRQDTPGAADDPNYQKNQKIYEAMQNWDYKTQGEFRYEDEDGKIHTGYTFANPSDFDEETYIFDHAKAAFPDQINFDPERETFITDLSENQLAEVAFKAYTGKKSYWDKQYNSLKNSENVADRELVAGMSSAMDLVKHKISPFTQKKIGMTSEFGSTAKRKHEIDLLQKKIDAENAQMNIKLAIANAKNGTEEEIDYYQNRVRNAMNNNPNSYVLSNPKGIQDMTTVDGVMSFGNKKTYVRIGDRYVEMDIPGAHDVMANGATRLRKEQRFDASGKAVTDENGDFVYDMTPTATYSITLSEDMFEDLVVRDRGKSMDADDLRSMDDNKKYFTPGEIKTGTRKGKEVSKNGITFEVEVEFSDNISNAAAYNRSVTGSTTNWMTNQGIEIPEAVAVPGASSSGQNDVGTSYTQTQINTTRQAYDEQLGEDGAWDKLSNDEKRFYLNQNYN